MLKRMPLIFITNEDIKMVTVNGKEADIEITNSASRKVSEIYINGYWLAEFSCPEDATTFVRTIKVEGRDYETFATNKLRVK